MAVLGLTKLLAVNRMLRAINSLPVTALDPGGSSLQARAEELLDDVNRTIQGRGMYSNTARSRTYTPVAGAIVVGSDVLKVKAAGADGHRNFTLRGDSLYDLDADSATFTAAVQIDVTKLISFESLSPEDKEYITSEAVAEFQRRWRGSPDQDRYNQENVAKASAYVKNPSVRPGDMPMNPVPASSLVPAAPTAPQR